jgi:cytochrome c oxidase cbb3-type subunit 3
MKMKKSFIVKFKFVLAVMLLSVAAASAQTAATNPATELPDLFSNADWLIVAGIALFLLAVVYALGKSAIGLSKVISETGKKTKITIALLLLSASAFSQTDAVANPPSSELPGWVSDPATYILFLLFFVLVFAIYALYTANIKLIKVLDPNAFASEEELALETATEEKPGLLQRIYLRLVDSVPVAKEKDILLDHDYDGIKELDNNLPPWWKYGFYVTIAFAVCYLFIYHVSGIGKLQGQEYKDELVLAAQQKEERLKARAENITEENVVALTDAALIASGKETFQKLCIVCHRADGGGQVGPNLTDEYWLHGGGIKNIFKTITYGVPNKGMLSWQSQLSPKQIQQVASYVLSLKGTNPPGPKEPQGEKWIEEVVPVDSIPKATTDSSTVVSANKLKN